MTEQLSPMACSHCLVKWADSAEDCWLCGAEGEPATYDTMRRLGMVPRLGNVNQPDILEG